METRPAAHIHVGTSGWSYPHWKRRFYPAGLPPGQWLPYYAQRFATVEIDNTFYRLPARQTFASWARAVPPEFTFAVKASRYITHMKKLSDPRRSTRALLRRITALGSRLGPLLFQLPPRWRADAGRLDAFLGVLGPVRTAFEFRDRSWIRDDVLAALARHRAAFCIHDFGGRRTPKLVTSDFVYLRLHGPAAPYRGSYGSAVLARWADACSDWAGSGREVYCYFNNDQDGCAPRDALRLRRMVERRCDA
jgi:uncharacterized protein YecE (DUF72 family)